MVFLIVAAVAFVIGLNLFAYWSVQVRYINHHQLHERFFSVCYSHISYHLLQMSSQDAQCASCRSQLGFIYQLKHESRWARCIFKNTKWIRTITGWIGVLMDAILRRIRRLLAWTWSYMSRPYRNCRPSLLHLLRNIFWYVLLFW